MSEEILKKLEFMKAVRLSGYIRLIFSLFFLSFTPPTKKKNNKEKMFHKKHTKTRIFILSE
jgi:hypothetical protein